MQIEFRGRQMEVTPDLQAFAEERLRKLKRVLRGSSEIHAILTAEKHRRRAEFTLNFRNHTLVGIAETDDPRTAIQRAVAKIERQVVRLFERRRTQKRRPKPSTAVLFNVLASSNHGSSALRSLEIERVPLKVLDVEEAIGVLDAARHGVVVFRNSGTERVNVVYRAPDGHLMLVEPVS